MLIENDDVTYNYIQAMAISQELYIMVSYYNVGANDRFLFAASKTEERCGNRCIMKTNGAPLTQCDSVPAMRNVSWCDVYRKKVLLLHQVTGHFYCTILGMSL